MSTEKPRIHAGKQHVAFDVDGCLIDDEDRTRWPVLDILRAFLALRWVVVAWSGGGVDYARHWVDRLGLRDMPMVYVAEKGSVRVDVTFDDERVELGVANVCLPCPVGEWNREPEERSSR